MSKFLRRPDDRPREILAAAVDTFFEKGFAGSTLDEIAARAGISKGTILLYYKTKKDLLLAAMQAFQQPLADDMAGAFAQLAPPYADAFAGIAQLWRERVATSQNPRLAKIMFAEGNQFPELLTHLRDTMGARVKAAFVTLLERGVASGEFAVADVETTARYLMGGIVFLEHWNETIGRFGSDPIDIDAYLAVWVRSARQLVLAPPTPPRRSPAARPKKTKPEA